jgi:hypothetical protein
VGLNLAAAAGQPHVVEYLHLITGNMYAPMVEPILAHNRAHAHAQTFGLVCCSPDAIHTAVRWCRHDVVAFLLSKGYQLTDCEHHLAVAVTYRPQALTLAFLQCLVAGTARTHERPGDLMMGWLISSLCLSARRRNGLEASYGQHALCPVRFVASGEGQRGGV